MKCVEYSDMSLRRFMEKASKQKWYNNTLFVFVADHTNESENARYQTDMGFFEIPIIFYTPDGSIKAEIKENVIAQQVDIMPTILGYLGYDGDYFGFGRDLMNERVGESVAVNYNNGVYQYVKGDYVIQFDGERTRAIYNFKRDEMLKNNLLGQVKEAEEMERELKAMIQQYMERMIEDRLTVDR